MSNNIESLIQRADDLFSSPERVNIENIWSELAEYMLNNQHSFNNQTSTPNISSGTITSTPGVKRTKNLYDSTAPQAVQDLAAAFQGTLTNPATVWSKLRYNDDELNDNEEAVRWLEDVNTTIHKEFNESNFDTEIAKSYQSFVALSNMVLFQEQKDDTGTGVFDGFRFTSLHLGQIAWAENKDGVVDTVYRKFTLTARQAVQKWPKENLSDSLIKALGQSPDTQFDFMQCVFPREPEDIKLNEVGLAPGEFRPIANIYIDLSAQELVEETGYYEFPIHAVRWGTMPGETYGRGPANIAIPDTRTLNRLKQRGLEAIDLQVRPPIFANQRDVFGQLDMRPGGISIVKDHKGVREFVSQGRSDILQFSVAELRESIKSIFFLDKIQPLSNLEKKERMSQLEVVKRLEEIAVVLGPTISRLNSELLQPLIVRAFKMLLRSGKLPEVPGILKDLGINVDVVFVNQLARSQQVQDISNIQQWIQNIAQLAQVKPEVLDYVNADGVATHTAKILGVPEIAITNKDEVEEIREARAQQQQQQQALQSANLLADTVSKAGLTTGE